ncbi:galactose-6-phosphate isomerase subunit LacA [Virgibacillus proomii]|uniref:galactose-6-phosphate isomerase subunit LacA n=1 Tax=Virgibacillus proomii TaxID=84407 RepID=UPI001C128132|nr:galactose-6-phosphate isomerase subunit LacA [Virgibacillus proomii]MBU5266850.1 galactose-6-phosphate isomerase subunit LacA [Virgibacillus proomii]
MKIAIASDQAGFELKEKLKNYLENHPYEIIDVTKSEDYDFVEAASKTAKAINEAQADRGIVVDEYGVGSSITANKYKGIICANVFDEHSARMTVRHNNTSIIAIGSGIVGEKLAKRICDRFLQATYDGGRHQIRVDMLNKMC